MNTENRAKEEFKISGMSCGHCVEAVKRAIGETEGVESSEVGMGTATVEFDAEKTDRERIAAAIADAGYEVVG